MRILHVAQPTMAGVYRYVLQAASDQRRRGWDVHVACPDDGPLAAEVTAAGIGHVEWAASREPGLAVLAEAQSLVATVRRLRPDVVHLHSAKAGLAGRLGLRGRVPTLFQPHGWSWLASRGVQRQGALAWERWAVRWCTRVIACGVGEVEQGRRAGVRGTVSVVRNGIDLRRFVEATPVERERARRALGLPVDAPTVVCVGRLARQKGQDLLVSAWPQIRRSRPNAQLVLVGHGGPRDLAGTAFDRSGVHLFGAIEDVTPFYAAADVVALPSRWEGLSLTAMEALASGRPVVASDIPGLSELVPPGVGSLVPPESPADLARALVARLGTPDSAAREGTAAAAWAQGFDASRTYAVLAELTATVAHVQQRG